MMSSNAGETQSPYGWETAFAWCPPEDSRLREGIWREIVVRPSTGWLRNATRGRQ